MQRRQTLIYLLIVTLCTALMACHSSVKPRLRQLRPDQVILAFGDSLTQGVGVPHGQAYPEVLERMIGIKVVNAGVPGEETADGLARIESELENAQPSLVILCMGGNDMMKRRDPKTIKKRLAEMIRIIKKHHADVVLIAVPRPALSLSSPDFYEELGEEFTIPVDTTTLPDLLADADYKSDPIHLNAKGYQLLAERVVALLKESGALQ